jgi:hypothetical protein
MHVQATYIVCARKQDRVDLCTCKANSTYESCLFSRALSGLSLVRETVRLLYEAYERESGFWLLSFSLVAAQSLASLFQPCALIFEPSLISVGRSLRALSDMSLRGLSDISWQEPSRLV